MPVGWVAPRRIKTRHRARKFKHLGIAAEQPRGMRRLLTLPVHPAPDMTDLPRIIELSGLSSRQLAVHDRKGHDPWRTNAQENSRGRHEGGAPSHKKKQ